LFWNDYRFCNHLLAFGALLIGSLKWCLTTRNKKFLICFCAPYLFADPLL